MVMEDEMAETAEPCEFRRWHAPRASKHLLSIEALGRTPK